jgi:phenylacetate-CoA ligase
VLAAFSRLETWKHEQPVCMIFKQQGLWGGARYVEGVVSRLGGVSLIVGIPPLGEALALIEEFRPNMMVSNPSYIASLTRYAQEIGFRHRFKAISLGAELLTPAQADLFRDYWGAEISNGYGLIEIGGVASGGNDCDALHFDVLHNVAEILDPETDEPSDEGELVVTTLVNEAMPLIRYRTRDRCRRVVCRCGWRAPAFRVLSRINDSIVVGGNNLHCPLVAEGLLEIESRAIGLEITIEHVNDVDRMTLRAEVLPGSILRPEDVCRQLFEVFPAMGNGHRSGSYELVVDIRRTEDLPSKFLRVRDLRH